VAAGFAKWFGNAYGFHDNPRSHDEQITRMIKIKLKKRFEEKKVFCYLESKLLTDTIRRKNN
jgi:hypothetical protein